MAKNVFHDLQIKAFRAGVQPRTKESREWFYDKARRLRLNRETVMKSDPLKKRSGYQQQLIGSMQMFTYDPKHKDTLPYYDNFPLVIVVGPAKDGFYGLNLHYLPPMLRMKFFAALTDIQTSGRGDDQKLRMTYDMLKKVEKLRFFKPCFKHYLAKHVKSNFAEVPMPEWEIAAFLPLADFKKASTQKVFADSRKQVL